MVMYDNEFETKENRIWTEDEIYPENVYYCIKRYIIS